MDFFENTRVLGQLDEAGRKRLLEAGQVLTFADGSQVVREGEPGDALYIIMEGSATVAAEDLGTQKQVAELAQGALFGEMAVITNQPRSATVTARGELKVMRIPRDVVVALLDDYPAVKELVAKLGVERTEETMEKLLQD